MDWLASNGIMIAATLVVLGLTYRWTRPEAGIQLIRPVMARAPDG